MAPLLGPLPISRMVFAILFFFRIDPPNSSTLRLEGKPPFCRRSPFLDGSQIFSFPRSAQIRSAPWLHRHYLFSPLRQKVGPSLSPSCCLVLFFLQLLVARFTSLGRCALTVSSPFPFPPLFGASSRDVSLAGEGPRLPPLPPFPAFPSSRSRSPPLSIPSFPDRQTLFFP